MQKIVIVANGAPYGSESLFNSLRLARPQHFIMVIPWAKCAW